MFHAAAVIVSLPVNDDTFSLSIFKLPTIASPTSQRAIPMFSLRFGIDSLRELGVHCDTK
jgi:hypothetical protein